MDFFSSEVGWVCGSGEGATIEENEGIYVFSNKVAVGPFSMSKGMLFCIGGRASCAASSKKKHTEHERVQFWSTAKRERGPYTHVTRQKNTLNTRECSFGVLLNPRGCLARTYTHSQ